MYTAKSYLQQGLGAVAPLPTSVSTYQVPIPTATPAPAPTGNFWDSLSNIFSNVNKVATQAAPLVTQVKQTVDVLKNNTVPGYTTTNQTYVPQPIVQPMSTAKKVLIGAGIAGAAFLGYQALKPKKK